MTTLEKVREDISSIEISGQIDVNTSFVRTSEQVKNMALAIIDKYAGQEPCDDAVSRQAVLDVLKDKWNMFSDANDAMQESIDTIEAFPSVRPQESKWIPVSEKLPDDRDWYLGIFRESDTGWIHPLPFICDYVGRETKATTKEYWILRGFTDMDKHIDYYFNLECVAWMPLPKPYEPQESEEK